MKEQSKKILHQFKNLSEDSIAAAVALADTHLSENGVDREQRESFSVVMKNALLDYAAVDSNARLLVFTYRLYRKAVIQLRIRCKSLNVLEGKSGFCGEDVLAGMSSLPEWKYRRGENILIYSEKVLVPGRDSMKKIMNYMADERKTFRFGIALWLVNMLLLVVEPLLAR